MVDFSGSADGEGGGKRRWKTTCGDANLGREDHERVKGFHGFGVLWNDPMQEAHHGYELPPVQGITHEHHPLASKHFQH